MTLLIIVGILLVFYAIAVIGLCMSISEVRKMQKREEEGNL